MFQRVSTGRALGWRRKAVAVFLAAAVCAAVAAVPGSGAGAVSNQRQVGPLEFEVRSLSGAGNNESNPAWGQAGTNFLRIGDAAYADGVSAMQEGPNARYVSNRVFNDVGVTISSRSGMTQWGWLWGQFMDHTFGLSQEGHENIPIAFDPADPLETFTNDFGAIPMTRSAAADGTGESTPREQVNLLSSFIDAANVYGVSEARLEWLREGPVDGDMSNNGPRLRTTAAGYLPRVDALGDPSSAPPMAVIGRLQANPNARIVAGDVRANENVALTAIHTLFVREHNRIVDALPEELDDQLRFEIARRVVGAQLQYITYEYYLPALGVKLDKYQGYDSSVNPTLRNEFSTVGFRAHSQVHDELSMNVPAGRYTPDQLASFQAQGIQVAVEADGVELGLPLSVSFGSPGLVDQLGLASILTGMSATPQRGNDAHIDDQLRSVLFQVPGPGVTNPADCFVGPALPECFSGVIDLGALDVDRARDHGIPRYNDLREAYGLPRVTSFEQITGEKSADFHASLGESPIDNPAILEYTKLQDRGGNALDVAALDGSEDIVKAAQRSPLAARLAAIYGSVDEVDAFTGMVSERAAKGSELGELQLAIWTEQFEALRDGDRFFYLDDPVLDEIKKRYGIDYRTSIEELLVLNTAAEADDLPASVFRIGKTGSGGKTR